MAAPPGCAVRPAVAVAREDSCAIAVATWTAFMCCACSSTTRARCSTERVAKMTRVSFDPLAEEAVSSADSGGFRASSTPNKRSRAPEAQASGSSSAVKAACGSTSANKLSGWICCSWNAAVASGGMERGQLEATHLLKSAKRVCCWWFSCGTQHVCSCLRAMDGGQWAYLDPGFLR